MGFLQDMLPLQLPWTIGFDVSGVVIAIGTDVDDFSVGDEVFARANTMQAGTIAEQVVVKAIDLALKPANLTHVEAASIPLVGLTAWQSLVTSAGLQAGEKVLIHAGSGGVGTIAIQIAKHIGAYVATTASASSAETLTALGADQVIDYRTEQFDEELSNFDVVFDLLGGETLERSVSVLKRGGRLVSIKGALPDGAADAAGVSFELVMMSPDGEMLAHLGRLLATGEIKPMVDRTYELADVQDAYSYSESGRAKGKIVIDFGTGE
jgi:NADPH:quinone reductase-like Zn-dependent oxidoreductase